MASNRRLSIIIFSFALLFVALLIVVAVFSLQGSAEASSFQYSSIQYRTSTPNPGLPLKVNELSTQALELRTDYPEPVNETMKVKGLKAIDGGCEFFVEDVLPPDFHDVVKAEFTWDDPVIVETFGIDPMKNPALFDIAMEKPRKANQENCTAFFKKTVTKTKDHEPLMAEKGKSESASLETEITSPPSQRSHQSMSNLWNVPQTVFPVQRGEAQASYIASGSSLGWVHQWFEDPLWMDVNEVWTWARWSWNGYTAYNGSGGDYRWWLAETGWKEFYHQLDEYWANSGNQWWYNVNTFSWFRNYDFCYPWSYSDPTQVIYSKNQVIGAPDGHAIIRVSWWWGGACSPMLHPHYEYSN